MLFSSCLFAEDNDKKTIREKEKVIDDVFIISQSINNKGDIVGDLTALVFEINNNGTVYGDVLSGSVITNINGIVKGDLRNFSWITNLNGEIRKNLTTFSKDININKGSVIEGSITVYCKNLTIDGRIDSDVRGKVNRLIINGIIKGDVDIIANKIEFGNNGLVLGNLNYKSRNSLKIPKKNVRGNITSSLKNEYLEHKFYKIINKTITFIDIIKGFSLIILGVLLSIFFKDKLNEMTSIIINEKYITVVYGFSLIIISIFISILLAITIIGIPLSIILIVSLSILSYVIKVPVGNFLGKLILKNNSNTIIETILGLSVIILLGLLPYIGIIFDIIFSSLGFGVLYFKYFNKIIKKHVY